LKITSLSTHIKELQKLLEEKNAKIEQLEQKKNGLADVEGIRIAPG
jgi:predicted RNase H-like nuclease (RuvC/YqgF family)